MDDMSRRQMISGTLAISLVPTDVRAAPGDDDVGAAIERITAGAKINPGRVSLEMPPIAENGNFVTLTISVESPMTPADHVKAIHVVAEKNPIADVVKMYVGPRAGRARVSTSIRLATSQTITAIAAMSDGSFWSGTAEVVVTLAACTESG